jgi:hypothetical protein
VSDGRRPTGDRDPPAREVWSFALAFFAMALAAAVYAPTPLWKVVATAAFLALGVAVVEGARGD